MRQVYAGLTNTSLFRYSAHIRTGLETKAYIFLEDQYGVTIDDFDKVVIIQSFNNTFIVTYEHENILYNVRFNDDLALIEQIYKPRYIKVL